MNLPPLPEPDGPDVGQYVEETLLAYGESCARMAREEERERAEIFRMERDAARVQNDHIMKVLVGIHALLPPNTIEADGRTYVFNDQDANETLRELKRRINAIEEEAAAAIRKELWGTSRVADPAYQQEQREKNWRLSSVVDSLARKG